MPTNSTALIRIGELARRLGVSASYVRKLADTGRLPFTLTPGGHRMFDAATATLAFERRRDPPAEERSFALERLDEGRLWQQLGPSILPAKASREARRIVEYAFTEMVNNAIDHSGGSRVDVRWRAASTVTVTIADDGIGALERMRSERQLADHLAALAEITKGKATTRPDRHSGEGIFFTSRAVDRFDLQANGLRWLVDQVRGDRAAGESAVQAGTRVQFEVDATTGRRLEDVFAEYTDDDYAFSRSEITVRLFEQAPEFISRSEAKRLLAGLDAFRTVDLDFEGVELVGQGFADEVFRVWQNAHPQVTLQPRNMNRGVEFMVRRAMAARSGKSASLPNAP